MRDHTTQTRSTGPGRRWEQHNTESKEVRSMCWHTPGGTHDTSRIDRRTCAQDRRPHTGHQGGSAHSRGNWKGQGHCSHHDTRRHMEHTCSSYQKPEQCWVGMTPHICCRAGRRRIFVSCLCSPRWCHLCTLMRTVSHTGCIPQAHGEACEDCAVPRDYNAIKHWK